MNRMKSTLKTKLWICALASVLLGGGALAKPVEGSRSNIIFVMPDDA